MSQLILLSGGAAFGLVSLLQGRFAAENACSIAGTYNAVGVMRDQLLAGAPCDVLILTRALIDQLEASGHVLAGTARDLGRVRTGVAVKTGAHVPAVDTPDALKTALLAASEVYFPDPIKATAGIHFMKVLRELGIDQTLAARLRPFANGATAMSAMAEHGDAAAIGCTQVTEILYTLGVQLVAPLPPAFELATVYTAAVSAGADSPNAGRALIDLLCGPYGDVARRAGGFDA